MAEAGQNPLLPVWCQWQENVGYLLTSRWIVYTSLGMVRGGPAERPPIKRPIKFCFWILPRIHFNARKWAVRTPIPFPNCLTPNAVNTEGEKAEDFSCIYNIYQKLRLHTCLLINDLSFDLETDLTWWCHQAAGDPGGPSGNQRRPDSRAVADVHGCWGRGHPGGQDQGKGDSICTGGRASQPWSQQGWSLKGSSGPLNDFNKKRVSFSQFLLRISPWVKSS